MGQLNPPATVLQFQTMFSRDFVYGPGLDTVRPVDIQNALDSAAAVFNPELFSLAPIGVPPNVKSEALICYLNASAHFLVTSIQGVGGLGTKNGGLKSQGEGIIGSKSVGGVSVGYVWPSTITDNAALYQFTKTTYGQAYLQVLMLKLVGNVSAVIGEVADNQDVPFL